jgi:DNA-binding NarL/FixJ family response regulator
MIIAILGNSERMRAALQAVLESRDRDDEFLTGQGAQAVAHGLAGRHPHVVVVACWSASDLLLTDTLRQIRSAWPEARSLVLAETTHNCQVAHELGADETLLHDPSATQLFAAIDRLKGAGRLAEGHGSAA